MHSPEDFSLVSGLSSHLSTLVNGGGPSGFAVAGEQQWKVICDQAERLRAAALARSAEIADLERMLRGEQSS